jgi:hypothetical protein
MQVSELAREVYWVLCTQAQGNEGVSVSEIAPLVESTHEATLSAGNELVMQGLVYTTVLESCFAIVENEG